MKWQKNDSTFGSCVSEKLKEFSLHDFCAIDEFFSDWVEMDCCGIE